jgi:hypothetical protein
LVGKKQRKKERKEKRREEWKKERKKESWKYVSLSNSTVHTHMKNKAIAS